MKELKVPIRVKVIEALTAALDGRVELVGDGRAIVGSSDGAKRYTVTWSQGGRVWRSSDPATMFQGVIGYPIIAVMIETGQLSTDLQLAAPLKGISWKELNDRFRRDYEKAAEFAMNDLSPDVRAQILTMADAILGELAGLNLLKG